LLVERRPVRAFVDPLVGRERDDQDVAKLAGLVKVPQVADVNEVEHAMTMDDPFPLGLQPRNNRRQVVQSTDFADNRFAGGGHAVRSSGGRTTTRNTIDKL